MGVSEIWGGSGDEAWPEMDWKACESLPFSLVKGDGWWSSASHQAFESSVLLPLGASCVFLRCLTWHSTLFLYTLVSHPTTIPDIQRLAGHGYFYWKIKNLSKLLFSFFLFLFFPLLRNKGCKLFEISQKPNSSFAYVFEMAP